MVKLWRQLVGQRVAAAQQDWCAMAAPQSLGLRGGDTGLPLMPA
ncbi:MULTISPECIES: hypothetical protein [Comamonas]|nr:MULTISPECIES: hypothetical protein [Comamonas]